MGYPTSRGVKFKNISVLKQKIPEHIIEFLTDEHLLSS